MKNKTVVSVSLALAAVLALLPDAGDLLDLAAMPLILLARGLRYLSLLGTSGNGAAWLLYVLACLSPMLLRGRGKWRREDWLLVLTCAVTAAALYGMINPGVLPGLQGSDAGLVQLAFGVYSALTAWAVVRLLRSDRLLRQDRIYSALRIFLLLCAGSLMISGVGSGLRELLALSDTDTNALTCVFLALRQAASAAESLLNAWVLLCGVSLLRELERDAYSADCVAEAERTAAWCRRSLMAVTGMNLALNLGQLACAAWLRDSHISLQLPIFSMALAFVTLSLTRLLVQGRALKEDNDLFI